MNAMYQRKCQIKGLKFTTCVVFFCFQCFTRVAIHSFHRNSRKLVQVSIKSSFNSHPHIEENLAQFGFKLIGFFQYPQNHGKKGHIDCHFYGCP